MYTWQGAYIGCLKMVGCFTNKFAIFNFCLVKISRQIYENIPFEKLKKLVVK